MIPCLIASTVRASSPCPHVTRRPGPEELAQYWTLSPQDKHEVCKCRGEAQRQFCRPTLHAPYLRPFLAQSGACPNGHHQSSRTAVGFTASPLWRRSRTFGDETDHFHHIRTYLGWQPFDDTSQVRLITWLNQRATDDLLQYLGVPCRRYITRVENCCTRALNPRRTRSIRDRACAGRCVHTHHLPSDARLHPGHRRAASGPTRRAPVLLFQLKEYPAEASYTVILRYIEHYHFLRDFGVDSIDLDGISPPMMRYLADQGKRYDVHTLRRFPEAKRYSLTACFLVEIHKTILDHIVSLHDQLLTKKIREARNTFETRYRQVRRQSRRGFAKLITTGQTLLDPERAPRRPSRICCMNSMSEPA